MIDKKILYITYDGLLDPLGKSQILPYILGLQERGFELRIVGDKLEINGLTLDWAKEVVPGNE